MKSFNQYPDKEQEKLNEDLTDVLWAAAIGGGLLGMKAGWDKWGKGSVVANALAFTKKGKAKVAKDAEEKRKEKVDIATTILDDPRASDKDKKEAEKDLEKHQTDDEKKERAKKIADDPKSSPEVKKKAEKDLAKFSSSVEKSQRKLDKQKAKEDERTTKADAAAIGYKKDEDGIIISVGDAEKYKKKAKKAPTGWETGEDGRLFRKDKEPEKKPDETEKETKLVPKGTKMTITESNELQAIMALDDAGIKAEINRKGEVVVKKKDLKKAKKALEKSFKKGGQPKLVGEEIQLSPYDKIKEIRNRLNESSDEHAETELKLYIENDPQLYRQQIIPIIKNVQRKMKKGTYDHIKAPKLWMYLVDNGAKKYVKEFGGDVRRDFPKDVRQSVAVQFANEYRAEIEIQGGEMV